MKPTTAFSPATAGGGPGGEPTAAAITLSWPTVLGKTYAVFYLPPDLGAGPPVPVGAPFVGGGGVTHFSIPTAMDEKGFFRVAVTDDEADTDGDGMTDYEEDLFGSDPASADSDNDGLGDLEEYFQCTDPWSGDTDGDGTGDFEEIRDGTDPRKATPTIQEFRRRENPDGTVTYTWISFADEGDWFRLEEKDGSSWKTIYSTTYGSAALPFIFGKRYYSLTLNPATDLLP